VGKTCPMPWLRRRVRQFEGHQRTQETVDPLESG
jgi:hypothetical protein